jgi:hypothetical protein
MISRMQSPRQNYGLGSFVKKAVRKVTSPVTKVAKKIVPKEVAGIMRAAAPFLPAGYREAAYLLGTAKQTGRISPMDLALTAAPAFFSKTDLGRGIAQRVGDFTLPGMKRDLRTLAVGSPREVNFMEFEGPQRIAGNIDPGFTTKAGLGGQNIVSEATQGLFGKAGDMNLLKGSLLADPSGKIKLTNAAALGTGILSLVQNSKTPQEAGENLVAATGNPDDYERGFNLFSRIPEGAFDIPQRFQLPAANGGLMRTNFARGSDEEPKPLPEDPTKPVNPFQPKPIGPFPSKMASVDEPFYRREYLDENAQEMFKKPYKDLTPDELEEFREEMERLKNKFSKSEDTMMAGIPKDLDMETAIKTFRMVFERDPKSIDELLEFFKNRTLSQGSRDEVMLAKEGGLMRENFALGTRPTEQESGLGGLPIEADMRYSGGFMPYGAKEKADDVPARLSKNEFVFTADAVRAAGGGSVNEGARKMYQAMKQLEAKPEAKGMMA